MDENAFLIRLSEGERTDFGRVEFALQSEPQKVFSAIWQLESLVNNGGFDAFFRYSDTDLISFAPAALRTVGAVSCAGIVGRAIDVVAPLPDDCNGREEILDSLDDNRLDQISALDDEFYAYPDDLTRLLFGYVKQHPAIFGPS